MGFAAEEAVGQASVGDCGEGRLGFGWEVAQKCGRRAWGRRGTQPHLEEADRAPQAAGPLHTRQDEGCLGP